MEKVDKSLDPIQHFKAYPVTLVSYYRKANCIEGRFLA